MISLCTDSRDPVPDHNLTWWQKNHPSFVLYKCDKKTPAQMWTDKNMVLDISSEEVIEWQLRGADNMYSVERLGAQGFDAIAADNCECHGDSLGCGVP